MKGSPPYWSFTQAGRMPERRILASPCFSGPKNPMRTSL